MTESSKKFEIREAKNEIDILNCYPVLKILRPHLKYVEEYIERVNRQHAKGYRLFYIADSEKVLIVIGFTIRERLLSGKTVYLEDFCALNWTIHEELGPLLINWLLSYAKEAHCDNIVTESAFTRYEIHRFYLNHGFKITAHHFSLPLIGKKVPSTSALQESSS
ncbi:uncharacterized protein LOC107370755 [Tetranychus urticae]|uniref:N-acetyltransferase domain-containing protein n=1 Tax=Tetranychus urticae TaxID=32264 RepID=T1JUJ8_TETUR|nr:uncharacterized protein LOC107370755 [Tetranychus urticae]